MRLNEIRQAIEMEGIDLRIALLHINSTRWELDSEHLANAYIAIDRVIHALDRLSNDIEIEEKHRPWRKRLAAWIEGDN